MQFLLKKKKKNESLFFTNNSEKIVMHILNYFNQQVAINENNNFIKTDPKLLKSKCMCLYSQQISIYVDIIMTFPHPSL